MTNGQLSEFRGFVRSVTGKSYSPARLEAALEVAKGGVLYYSVVGSYDGAIKIGGKWVRAVELNRIDKTGWIRWSGPASPAIIAAIKAQPPTQATDLFPNLVIHPKPAKAKNPLAKPVVHVPVSEAEEQYPDLMAGKWRAIASSNLRAIKYDQDSKVLSIKYKDGSVYEYYNVGVGTLMRFIHAASAGAARWHVLGDPRSPDGPKFAYARVKMIKGPDKPWVVCKYLHEMKEAEDNAPTPANVDPAALKEADFIHLPEGVKGTNCENCIFEEKGVCFYPTIRGQKVTERDCCRYWDNPEVIRVWQNGDTFAPALLPYSKSLLVTKQATGAPKLPDKIKSFTGIDADKLWVQCHQLQLVAWPDKLPVQIGEIDGQKLVLVNGDKVKRSWPDQGSMDFVEAGNGYRFSFIPKDQYWLDASKDKVEWPFNAYHEAIEAPLMASGMEYDPAHDIANKYEYARRHEAGRLKRADEANQQATKADPDRKVLALDFDGTIADGAEGSALSGAHLRENVDRWLDRFREMGVFLRLWTARPDVQEVQDWLKENKIKVDEVQRKDPADVYVDDKAVNSEDRSWNDLGPEIMIRMFGKARQPLNEGDSYKELLEKAVQGQAEMEKMLEVLKLPTYRVEELGLGDLEARAKEPGGFVLIAPIKTEERSKEKVNNDYGGNWSKLLDPVRASVVAEDMDSLRGAVAAIKDGGVQYARFPKDRFKEPLSNGYRDYLCNYRLPCGIICEVQFHLKPMLLAREKEKLSYDVVRAIKASMMEEGREEMTPAEAEAIRRVRANSRRLYARAWQEIQDSEEGLTDDNSSLQEKGLFLDSVQAAGRWLANKWKWLEQRYGRKRALLMAIAMLATEPIPGNMMAIIAIAEAIRGIHGWATADKELQAYIKKHYGEMRLVEKNYDVKIEREGGKWNAYELVDGNKGRILASGFSREVLIEQISRVTGGRFTLKEKAGSYFEECPRDDKGHCKPSGRVGSADAESSVPPPKETGSASDVQQSYIEDAAKLASTEHVQRRVERLTEKMQRHDARWSQTHDKILKMRKRLSNLEKAHQKETDKMNKLFDEDAKGIKEGKGAPHTSADYAAQGEKIDLALGKFLKVRGSLTDTAWNAIRKSIDNPDHRFNTGASVIRKISLKRNNLDRSQEAAVADVEKRLSGSITSLLSQRIEQTEVFSIAADQKQRAYFKGTRHGGSEQGIYLPVGGRSEDTVAHELGHSLETNANIAAAAQGFLYKRVGNEPPKPLGNGYESWEMGREDEFGKAFGISAAYVGKHYKSDDTEIVSMGLEKIFSDPTKFAEDDPEYFKFMLGVLDGSFA